MWGVWDSRRGEWTLEPQPQFGLALEQCRKLNEDWGECRKVRPSGHGASRDPDPGAPDPPAVEAMPDDCGGPVAIYPPPSGADRVEIRPQASRSRLAEMLLTGLFEDFEKFGKEAIAKMREGRPHEYLKLMMALAREESSGGGPMIAALGRILDRS